MTSNVQAVSMKVVFASTSPDEMENNLQLLSATCAQGVSKLKVVNQLDHTHIDEECQGMRRLGSVLCEATCSIR
jgi:hypothetical protein